jgi:hypothetical protein
MIGIKISLAFFSGDDFKLTDRATTIAEDSTISKFVIHQICVLFRAAGIAGSKRKEDYRDGNRPILVVLTFGK